MITSLQKLESQFNDQFLNNFKILRLIGQGTFAKVFLVYDQKQKNQLAVKKISLFGLDQYQRKLILNQAKILSSIVHPNIIKFHSCIYDNKEQNAYIFMQYAKDGDLSGLIFKARQENKQISQETIWHIIADICQALRHLHINGIIHRDIKPANILINQGKYKLADMNVSKIQENGNITTRTNIGTPLYTSPQVAKKKLYNEKCDIWSLGVVVYELCCLRNPFNVQSLGNLNNIQNKKIPTRFSIVLNKCIKKMLIEDPNERIQIIQILQMCQSQGIYINQTFDLKKQEFKTIIFPATSKRWVNLVAQRNNKIDSMVSLDNQLKQIKQQMASKKSKNFGRKFKLNSYVSLQENLNQEQSNIKDLNMIIEKKLILKNKEISLPKINNPKSSQLREKIEAFQGPFTSRQNIMVNQNSPLQNQSGTNSKFSFYRSRSRTKDYQINHSHQKNSSRNGLRFIKLSKDFLKNS